MANFAESIIEQAAIEWLKDLRYGYAFDPEIAFNFNGSVCLPAGESAQYAPAEVDAGRGEGEGCLNYD
jgi:hypothetical protein